MAYEAQGKVLEVGHVQAITEKFSKRELILEIDDGKFPQTCSFEFTGDKMDAIDSLAVNDKVRVEFNLRGRQWTSPKGEVKTFNTLSGWRVEVLTKAAEQAQAQADGLGDDSDIPF